MTDLPVSVFELFSCYCRENVLLHLTIKTLLMNGLSSNYVVTLYVEINWKM